MTQPLLPRSVLLLGLGGIAPQAVCLVLVFSGGKQYWLGLAAGCCYAATILSFLGGLWWMQGLLAGVRNTAIYIVAVMASVAGWVAMLPWCLGWRWPGPSLAGLGILLLASPLVDCSIGRHIALPSGWLRLRVVMASGLGALTLLIAALARA